ncbi:hypothetical protein F2Q69_00027405 [Brassica cretica]|uniref:Uncharacterized protein n=1 Tax=Brassica cretica TaxID=69181 RepID=A0A8S9RY75_BRACR|nr:hypothetical protein F2Q69_00027405 [Brassica cretica]
MLTGFNQDGGLQTPRRREVSEEAEQKLRAFFHPNSALCNEAMQVALQRVRLGKVVDNSVENAILFIGSMAILFVCVVRIVAHMMNLFTYESDEAEVPFLLSLIMYLLPISPAYLPSCEKHGLRLSELLFCWQPAMGGPGGVAEFRITDLWQS